MCPADRAQALNQHIERKDGGQRIGEQGNAIVSSTDALRHDAGANDGAEQGGGAGEFCE